MYVFKPLLCVLLTDLLVAVRIRLPNTSTHCGAHSPRQRRDIRCYVLVKDGKMTAILIISWAHPSLSWS